MSIDIVNESGAAVDERAVLDLGRYVLRRLRIHPLAELSVVLVDEAAIEQLHMQWMDEPGPTDVMSFPMDELRPAPDGDEPEPGLLGDVVICPAVAQRQAQLAGHSTDDEIAVLLVHGILHLLGYDHAEPDEEKEMFGLQAHLIADWRAGRR